MTVRTSAALFFAILLGASLTASVAVGADAQTALQGTHGGVWFPIQNAVKATAQAITLGPDRVEVITRLENRADTDRRLTLTVPLPEIAPMSDFTIYSLPGAGDPENPLALEVWVDGTAVAVTFERRVTALGLDHTALLQTLAVPPMPLADETRQALRGLEPGQLGALLEAGLLREDYDGVSPDWTMTQTAHWQQVIPAGGAVEVRLIYAPVTEYTLEPFLTSYGEGSPEVVQARADFCVDDALYEEARRREDLPEVTYLGKSYRFRPRLAGPVAGAVRGLTLSIDAGHDEDMVIGCIKDAVRTSPRQITLEAQTYWPQGDWVVQFLYRAQR